MKTTGVPLQNYDFQNSYEYNRDLNPSMCIVNGALALVLRIARCAGVAPLRVVAERTGGWSIAVSPSLAVFQRILITVFNMMALAALSLDIMENRDRRIRVGETTVAACVWIVDLVLVLAIASHIIYCGSARIENLIRILKQMHQINISLNNERSSKPDKIGAAAVVSMLVWAVVLQAIKNYTLIISHIETGFNWMIVVMYTPYNVAYSQGLLELMLWGATVAEVRAAAAALNDQLRQLLNESEFTTDALHVLYMIRRLGLSHEQIGGVMRQMNAGYGTFIMAMLMATFLHLVITPYYLLLWLNSEEALSKAVIIYICWGILHITTVLLAVEPCHCTHVQRETTKYLLSRLMVRLWPRTSQVSRELYQLSKQIMLNDVKFAPLGIYALGRPYTATMLSGVATYLVILLQFASIERH